MQADRRNDFGIVLVRRRELQAAEGSDAAASPLRDGYYIARLSSTAFTGVLAPDAVCCGPFAHIDEARSVMERLKSDRIGL